MQDQVTQLRLSQVEAYMLTSETSKDDVKHVYSRMLETNPLQLVYVTPERVAKSKTLLSKLQQSYQKGLLGRIAIDEVFVECHRIKTH